MSGETEANISGWTTDTLRFHLLALRQADAELRSERDRRYTEVSQEREKALKIKEQADRDALGLAREIQTYKDEKANELREQISRERGLYVTQQELKGVADKIDATMKPVVEFVSAQQGRSVGRLSQQTMTIMIIGVGISAVLAFIAIATVIVTVAYAIRS